MSKIVFTSFIVLQSTNRSFNRTGTVNRGKEQSHCRVQMCIHYLCFTSFDKLHTKLFSYHLAYKIYLSKNLDVTKMLKLCLYFPFLLFTLVSSDDSKFSFDGFFEKGMVHYALPNSVKINWRNFLEGDDFDTPWVSKKIIQSCVKQYIHKGYFLRF